MTLEQFRQLIETWGTVPANWPASSRDEAKRLLDTSDAARAMVTTMSGLDVALDRYEAKLDVDGLRQRILARLPEPGIDFFDRLWNWLVPRQVSVASLWRPVTAATLPLVLGIVLGGNVAMPADQITDNWEDEIQMLALVESDAEQVP